MKACVTTLNRRRSGSVARTEQVISTDVLRLGRATDCEVFMDDMRVSLYAARLHLNNGNILIEASGESTIIVNGQPARVATMRIGDTFQIGPYDFEVVAGAGDVDIAIDMEHVRAMDNALADLKARSRTRLGQTWLSRRLFAWAAFVTVFAALFVAPLVMISTGFMASPELGGAGGQVRPDAALPGDQGFKLETMWTSGELSDAHKYLSDSCESCHKGPFAGIDNEACFSCHTDVENHADPLLFASSSPLARGCVSCHKEHHGAEGITPQAQALCTTCHADMKATEPASGVFNVSDFGSHHPEFRPTVIANGVTGTTMRLHVDEAGRMGEQSNLKFSHAMHLRGDMFMPGSSKTLECASCHMPEVGSQAHLPIRMETVCSNCHKLNFDSNAPGRALPHGDVEGVRTALREFYQSIALEGSYKEQTAQYHGSRRRGIGGSSGSTTGAATDSAQVSGSPTTLKWAKAKSKAMERLVFGGAVCVTCHVVSESGTPDNPEWNVLPVKLSNRFLLKGAFDHGLHKTMECGSCHAAKTSQKATDLLLPGIETCRTCHAGEDSTGKVPSTCVDCHDYHVHGLSPMAGHNGMMQPFGTSPMPATPAAPTAPVVAPTQPAPVQPAPAGGM